MAQFNLNINLEYYLVLEGHQLDLIREVNKRLKEGWQPLGGIATWEEYLCQAVVREKPSHLEELDTR